MNLQGEIAYLQAHLANLELQPPPQAPPPVPHFSVSDLPTASTMPATYDLSSLIFDPVMQWPLQPILHHHNQHTSNINNAGQDHDQYVTLAIPQPQLSDHRGGASSSGGGGGVGHQGLLSDHHQLLVRHGTSGAGVASSSGTMHGSCSDAQRPSSQPK